MPSWKKIIVSGSDAELNQLTATSFGGNISGSATSTGSFGYLEIADSGGSPTIHLNEPAGAGGDSAVRMTEDGGFRGGFIKYDGTNNLLKIGTHANNNRTVSDDITAIEITRNDGYPYFKQAYAFLNQYLAHEGDTDTYLRYQTNQIDLSAGGNIFEINTTSLSGSAASTGSFGSGFFDGRVGIYQKTPTAELHISSPSSQPGIRVDGAYANIQLEGDNLAHISLKDEGATSGERVYQIVSDGGILNFNRTNDAISSVTATPLKLKDDKVEVLNISGSSTSTGSFGVVESAGDVIARNKAGAFISGDSLRVQLYRGSGQRQFLSDAATGGVAVGSGASVTGDGVSIGYLVTAGASSVAIGRGCHTSANEVRIGESGVTDAYLGQGNATLHVAGVVASGDITAQNFIVSSSVTSITYQSLSGSTIFGDDTGDTHQFTGSLLVTGSNLTIDSVGGVSGSSTSTGSFGHLSINGPKPASKQGDIYIGTTAGKVALHAANDSIIQANHFQSTQNHNTSIFLYDDNNVATRIHGQNYVRFTFGAATSGYDDRTFFKVASKNSNTYADTLLTGSLHITGSGGDLGSVTFTGNISGSSTSTGSFGKLFTRGNADVEGKLFIQPKNNTNNSTTAEELVIYGASTEAGIAIVANADANNYYTSYIKARYDGVEGFYIKGPSGDKFLSYGHSGTNTRIGVSDTTGTLHLRAKTISGSAASTGSFGHLMVGGGNFTSASLASAIAGGGGGISDVVDDTSPQLGGNLDLNSNDITGTGNINIAGNLTVLGTTSTISTTNIKIGDPFGFFATGSAGTNVDGGIIIQSGSAVDSGSAMYHDISTERWSVAKGIASTATTVTDSEWQGYVATVYTSSGSPVGESPKYGVGEIHIDENGDIFIYS
jgi:hypothetical protein